MQAKKIILGVAAVGLSTAIATGAMAAQPGFYAGVQAGYGKIKDLDNKGKGLAGRVAAGYQFNNNVGAELGWTKFHTAEDKAFGLKASVKTDAVDLVAKGTMPVADNFNVYGKVGGAYVIQRGEVTGWIKSKGTEKKLLPTAGVGVSYDFSPNVAADVSYTRIQKTGSSKIDSIDYVGAGLTYSFGG